jgi:hypothetical protein
MPLFSRRQWGKQWAQAAGLLRTGSPAKRRRRSLRPALQRLETRCVPTTAVGPGKFTRDFTSDTEFNSTDGVYEIGTSLAVRAGVTLTVDPGVTLLIEPGQTLTVNDVLSVGAGAKVQVTDGSDFGAGQPAGISVIDGGRLTASGASFTRLNDSNGSDFTQIRVAFNGQLNASGCEFNWDNVTLDPCVDLAGHGGPRLAGDAFDTALTPPATQVFALPLGQNLRFAEVDFIPGDRVQATRAVELSPLGTDGSPGP